MTADRLTAGKSADRLVYDCLEDRSGQVFFGRSFIDQRLDIRFGKYAAASRNRINFLVIFGLFVQPACVCLDPRSHVVDKRPGASGADAVHALFYISAFKINNFCVFAA